MDLSIVIPVADDLRIKECVESVDEDVEVIVALNGSTPAVEDIVRRLGVSTCYLPDRNLGAALDEGILQSKKENVIVTDSDCTFERNCIRILYEGLRDFKLAKGRIVHRKDNFMAYVLADLREFLVEGSNAYKPPLALRKSVIEDIGYYYDRDIRWVEDAEMNRRVKAKGLEVKYLPDAIVHHPSLTLSVDLRSAFRYGTGKRVGVEKGIMEGIGTHFSRLPNLYRAKGLLPAIYCTLWDSAYTAGYFAQAFSNWQQSQ